MVIPWGVTCENYVQVFRYFNQLRTIKQDTNAALDKTIGGSVSFPLSFCHDFTIPLFNNTDLRNEDLKYELLYFRIALLHFLKQCLLIMNYYKISRNLWRKSRQSRAYV